METQSAHMLLVHGCIFLLLGLAAGLPFWWVIIRRKPGGNTRAWRVAHTTLLMFGLLVIVIAMLSSRLDLSSRLIALLNVALLVSGYSFALALIVGAVLERRALLPTRNIADVVLFAGHVFGATGVTLGIGLLLYGLW